MSEKYLHEMIDDIEVLIDEAKPARFSPGKIMIEKDVLMTVIEELRKQIPGEIERSHKIILNKDAILEDARVKSQQMIDQAARDAGELIEHNEIVEMAKMRADELMRVTENTAQQLKIGTYEYLDSILYSFQGKMEHLSSIYFGEMFTSIEKAFDDINSALSANRDELKDMAYRAQMNADEMPEPSPIENTEK